MLLGLRFQELSWDHTSPEEEEPVLWLEFDGDSDGTPVNKLLRIYSKQVLLDRGWVQVPSAPQTTGALRCPGRSMECCPGPGKRVSGFSWPEQLW